jgi:hypothetical protein
VRTCLPNRCLEAVAVDSPYLAVVAEQRLYTLQCDKKREFSIKKVKELKEFNTMGEERQK